MRRFGIVNNSLSQNGITARCGHIFAQYNLQQIEIDVKSAELPAFPLAAEPALYLTWIVDYDLTRDCREILTVEPDAFDCIVVHADDVIVMRMLRKAQVAIAAVLKLDTSSSTDPHKFSQLFDHGINNSQASHHYKPAAISQQALGARRHLLCAALRSPVGR